jgi:hypothetical protein
MMSRTETQDWGRRGGGLRFAIGGVSVRVSSDLPELLEDLERLYPPDHGRGPVDERAIQIDVRARRTRLGHRRYAIYGDDQEITGRRRRCEVFPFVEWGINLRLIATRPEYVQLHAASMSRNGQGFIFAGGSGCGKSTLAAALLAGGWQYLCDEFALIERDTLCLHPFPKALCIKSGSFAALDGLGVPFARREDHVKGLKGRVAYINPLDLRPDAIGSPCSVRAVIFPMYVGTKRPRCVEVSRSRGLLELSGCVFNQHAFADRGLPVLHRLVQDARCFRLEIGDLVETRRALDAALQDAATNANAETSCPPNPAIHGGPRHAIKREGAMVLNRREVLRHGVRLAYTVPAVLTLTSSHAFAQASNPSGMCSTGVQPGGLCQTDSDCCSGDCTLGVCE